jgi:hypothetical protein
VYSVICPFIKIEVARMIEVRSYLGSINIQHGSVFTLVQDYTESVKDPRHIDGAIELTVNSIPLIVKEQWDLIDQLWIYIVNGMESVVNGESYTSSFPDSPTKLSLKLIKTANLIEMTVGDKTITHNLQELGNALLDGAANCLEELGRIMKKSDSYQEELQKINQVKTKLAEEAFK